MLGRRLGFKVIRGLLVGVYDWLTLNDRLRMRYIAWCARLYDRFQADMIAWTGICLVCEVI